MILDTYIFLLAIGLRILFIGFTVFLIYLIIECSKKMIIVRGKKHRIKLAVLSLVLIFCVFLGYTEPYAKIRIEMDTVYDAFIYIKQNKDVFSEGKDFQTNNMFGWVSYWDDETCKSVLKEIRMSQEKNESKIEYPEYILYGEIDGVKVYYEAVKCKRWGTLGHLPVDLLGVPDDCDNSISTMIYLISNNECVAVSVNYYGFNPFFFLQFLNSPYFFYSPEIDFKEIISQ